MQEENQRDEDDLRTARAVGTRQSGAMKRAKSQFALRPGRGLEAHESAVSKQSEWSNICSNNREHNCALLAATAGKHKGSQGHLLMLSTEIKPFNCYISW